jgi:hypothetical protein
MGRENNKYVNTVSGEVLNATGMGSFVRFEARRQYEELTGECFDKMTGEEQMECIMEQWKWQLSARDWKVIK